MTVLPITPWAKLDRHPDRSVRAALPLVDHCLDVGVVFETLLRAGCWQLSMTAAAERPLAEHDVARLSALAALHDIGKANSGFQARADSRAERVGHEGEVAALLHDAALRRTTAGQALLHVIRDWGAAPYMPALMAHHGRPREEFGPAPPTGGRNRSWERHTRHWHASHGYDPAVAATHVIDAVRARWPLAWRSGDPLPCQPHFVALFAGLLVLADWIGSDVARFPVEGPHGGARDALRMAAAADAIVARGLAPLATPAAGFTTAFELDRPRAIQAAATAPDLGTVALIEAETGSGKTEAALWRWLDLRRRGCVDGLFFALPTRVAAVQLHRRVDKMLRRVWRNNAPEAVLAVPGYLRVGDVDGHPLPGWEVRWDDGDHAEDRRWAAERSNRFLAARIAVGTIDQALLGALRVRHAPVRAAALARNLIVVDEVHASDAYTGGLLEQLLANHAAVGGHALLLSATLGGTARARLLEQPSPGLADAVAQPYPAVSGNTARPRPIAAEQSTAKQVSIELAGLIDDPDAIAARAVTAARAGASVLVIRNTVAGAVATAQAVENIAAEFAFKVAGASTVHHGRFAPGDRRLLDAAVEQAFGKGRSAEGRILIGTQTLEQSLDIDADLLLTDLAPMDVLLQRIGRLHRHAGRERGAFAHPQAVVLCRAARDLTPLLGPVRRRHGLGPATHGGPYPDLLQIEATLRQLEANPIVTIPADNRRLVEHALHPEMLAAIAADFGTAWLNHAADRAARAHGDRDTARDLSLDLSQSFRDLSFPDREHAILTRLGARDLLVDLNPPRAGPFGEPIDRLAIPAWMARGVTPADEPDMPIEDEDGWCFSLGPRRFSYGRWGLAFLS